MSPVELSVFLEYGIVKAMQDTTWNASCFLPERASWEPFLKSNKDIMYFTPEECYPILFDGLVSAVQQDDNLLVKFEVKKLGALLKRYLKYYTYDYCAEGIATGILEEIWIPRQYTSEDLAFINKARVGDICQMYAS
jgi:hypothetical protein